MKQISVELEDKKIHEIYKLSNRFGITPGEIINETLDDLLSKPDEDFQKIIKNILEKRNRIWKIKWFYKYGKIGMPGLILCVPVAVILIIIMALLLSGVYRQTELKYFSNETDAVLLRKFTLETENSTVYYIDYSFEAEKLPEKEVCIYNDSLEVNEKLFNELDEGSYIKIKYLRSNPQINSLKPNLLLALILLIICMNIAAGIIIGSLFLIRHIVIYTKIIKQGRPVFAEVINKTVNELKVQEGYIYTYFVNLSFEYENKTIMEKIQIKKKKQFDLYKEVEKIELNVLPVNNNLLYVSFPENKKNHVFS